MSSILSIVSPTLLYLCLLASVSAQKVIFEMDSAEATVYYDLTNSLCSTAQGGPFPANWAESTGINNGLPKCEQFAVGTGAKSLAQLGTNRVVAMNSAMVSGNLNEWCGKEVVVHDSTGNQITLDEGPFILWDACDACASASIIDMSAKAFTQIKGGTCGGGNPSGLKVQVLDQNIWQPITGSGGGGGPVAGSSSTTATPTQASSSTSTSSPAYTPGNGIKAEEQPNPTPSPGAQKVTLSQYLPTPNAASPFVATPPTDTTTGTVATAAAATPAVANDAANGASKSTSTSTIIVTPTVTVSAPAPTNPSQSTGTSPTPAVVPSPSVSAPAPAAGSPSPTAASPSPAAALATASGTPADCTIGKWQCSGLQLQVCNYLTINSLGWETIETCATKCSITDSGSVDCE